MPGLHLRKQGRETPGGRSKPWPTVRGFTNLEFHRQLLETRLHVRDPWAWHSSAGGRGLRWQRLHGAHLSGIPLGTMLPGPGPGFSCAVSLKELVPSPNCLAFLAQKAVDASTEQLPQPLTHTPGGSCRTAVSGGNAEALTP